MKDEGGTHSTFLRQPGPAKRGARLKRLIETYAYWSTA